MSKCCPEPSRKLSKYAPLIHVMKVRPDKINLIIGSGGKTVRIIIEETGVESIDTHDDGTVKITGKDLESIEKSKVMISNLTMVPTIGDIYRNCEIKSLAPYGVFVEIAPGREGLCHISELSPSYLAKAEDAFKIGDRIDVKLIEVNEKGQLRLSRRALLPDTDPLVPSTKQRTTAASKETAGTAAKSVPKKVANKDGVLEDKVELARVKVSTPKSSAKGNSEGDIPPGKVKRLVTKKGSKATSYVVDETQSSLVNGEAKIG